MLFILQVYTHRYFNIQELPQQAQVIIQLENNQIHNLGIKKMQNRGFTTDAQIAS